jgi:Na+/pantothenate symporter
VMPVASIATIEAAKVAVLVHCLYWHESYTRGEKQCMSFVRAHVYVLLLSDIFTCENIIDYC